MAGEDLDELFLERRTRKRAVDQVRTIEGTDELYRVLEAELRRDVPPHARRGGRGVGVQVDAGKELTQASELAVFGPEVVAPLTDAMCFVNGNEADVDGRKHRQEGVGPLAHQPLGRDIQQLVPLLTEARDDV